MSANARTKMTARKSTNVGRGRYLSAARKSSAAAAAGSRHVWHPTLTTAAELGEENLDAALEAEVEDNGGLLYETSGSASCPHSGRRVPEVPASPFPPHSSFGILAYAVWHGHYEVVKAYVDELEADPERTALVPVEPHLQVRVEWDQSERAGLVDTTPARALQIAVYKRDTRMAKLLLNWDADGHLPFLLDIVPPQAGSLFATKAGEWSSEGHWCFPPAFRAAVRQLLLISHKYGGVRRQDGQLRWPFRTEELVGLLLPVMGRSGSLRPWINRNDRLPDDAGSDDESSSSSSHDSGASDSDSE